MELKTFVRRTYIKIIIIKRKLGVLRSIIHITWHFFAINLKGLKKAPRISLIFRYNRRFRNILKIQITNTYEILVGYNIKI